MEFMKHVGSLNTHTHTHTHTVLTHLLSLWEGGYKCSFLYERWCQTLDCLTCDFIC